VELRVRNFWPTLRFPPVKHAGPETFDQLEDLLQQLRGLPELVERKRGTFYQRSRAFLHFHEDPTGPYADVRMDPDGDFKRFRVRTATDKRTLIRRVRAAVRT
jgi:hypothetical protein